MASYEYSAQQRKLEHTAAAIARKTERAAEKAAAAAAKKKAAATAKRKRTRAALRITPSRLAQITNVEATLRHLLTIGPANNLQLNYGALQLAVVVLQSIDQRTYRSDVEPQIKKAEACLTHVFPLREPRSISLG